MKVLFDTNLWISFMIGKRLASLADVLCRNDVHVYMSEQLLEEIQTVIARPKFNAIISAESRLAFQDMVDNVCYWTPITIQAESHQGHQGPLYSFYGRKCSRRFHRKRRQGFDGTRKPCWNTNSFVFGFFE